MASRVKIGVDGKKQTPKMIKLIDLEVHMGMGVPSISLTLFPEDTVTFTDLVDGRRIVTKIVFSKSGEVVQFDPLAVKVQKMVTVERPETDFQEPKA